MASHILGPPAQLGSAPLEAIFPTTLPAVPGGVVFAEGPQRRSAARLAELARQAADGALVTTVGATCPLADAAKAQQAGDSGHGRDKTVLTVG